MTCSRWWHDGVASTPSSGSPPFHADDVETTLADIDQCHRLLGLTPRVDLPAMIDRQVRAWTVASGREEQTPCVAAERLPAGGRLATQ